MKYVIIDLKRTENAGQKVYWKFNDFGYTFDTKEAKKFTHSAAEEIVNRPYSNLIMEEY